MKYSKKNVKTYIKINIKSAPTCFGFSNHHQGAWHLCTNATLPDDGYLKRNM